MINETKVVAFDVDGTLVQGGKRPEQMIEALHCLSRQIPVAFISGSSYQALEKKLVSELTVRNANFDVYASGGSVRLTYGCGQPVYDTTFAQDVRLPYEDIEGVRNIVETTARAMLNWGEDVQDAFWFMNHYRDWARNNQEGYVWSHPQHWKIKITNPGEIDPQSAIRVEARKDPKGERVVGLSVKSIPRMLNGKPTKFVGQLANNLTIKLHSHYQVMPAGFASIDVNMGNGHKGRAIEHIMSRLGILPHQILYFGDEFEHGNDKIVADLGVTCVDVSNSGPETTLKLLNELIGKI